LALEYYQKSLAIRINLFGENHADVAGSYNDIGFTYGKMGDPNKELECFLISENHPYGAMSYKHIAVKYSALEDC
jgi:hypothetical protein